MGSKNWNTMHLPFHLTSDYFNLQQSEADVIPQVLAHRWPTILDFGCLPIPQETSEHCDEERCGFIFIGECTQHMENTRLDKCTEHKFYDMQSFHLEQPDFFGVQEFEVIIYKTLHKIFLSNNYHNIISCIARLLSPELLNAEDFNCPITDSLVHNTLKDSQDFGAAMFPGGNKWIQLLFLSIIPSKKLHNVQGVSSVYCKINKLQWVIN
ncbi:uncharacterized protein VP01_3377g3 [Puccinia sorghi]|uniref:Uncharacterized protein n=1 Tax=Puccinia sorghi TaxID=27349 RepID=A0A0L6UWW3_9BASI|nr:uncharacterized protein VP01_3377g3 [Puccinia sorghi]